jgi:hypothetical protein
MVEPHRRAIEAGCDTLEQDMKLACCICFAGKSEAVCVSQSFA